MTFLEKWIKESEPIWNMQCDLIKFVAQIMPTKINFYWNQIAEIESKKNADKFLKEYGLDELYQKYKKGEDINV